MTAELYRVPPPSTEGEKRALSVNGGKLHPHNQLQLQSIYRAPISLWFVVDTQAQRKENSRAPAAKDGSQGGVTAAKGGSQGRKGTKALRAG